MRHRRLFARLGLTLLLLAGGGCNRHHPPPPTQNLGIVAAITLPCTVCNTRDFSVRIEFTNTSETRLKLNHYIVQLPQLVLAVFDAHGRPLPQVPPPVPPRELELFDKVLFPGESYEVSYPLAIRAALLPPGSYVLRARGFPSNTVRFRLAGITD